MHSTRRSFLIGGLQVTAAGLLGPWMRRASAAGGALFGEPRVLVVVQLSGGNDGLNTIVPRRQDAYFRLRPNLALPPAELHALDDELGLHPSLGELARPFGEGQLAVVQGVGYPGADRSHFRSMEVWHTADPEGPPRGLGWMGRLSDQITAEDPGAMAALHIGAGDLPLALHARDSFAPTARDARGFELEGDASFASLRDRLLGVERANPTGAFLRDAARSSYAAAERMQSLAERPSAASYPNLGLAQRLRLVARLVAGGFPTRLFHVELGGFDTHAQQARPHAELLEELGRSLAAFQADLESSGAAPRVCTLVFSEFGRRARENGSRGTDHGAAAPVLLLGDAVRGGVHGAAPDLEQLEDGDVPFHTDFRSIYSSLERDWMGLAPSSELPALDLIRSRTR